MGKTAQRLESGPVMETKNLQGQVFTVAESRFDERDEMFALMLADIDGRLEAIEQRTDRLVAQAA